MNLSALRLVVYLALLIAASLLFFAGCGADDHDDAQPDDDDSADDDDDDDNDDDSAETFLTLENDNLVLTIWLEPFGLSLSAKDKGLVVETLDYGQGDSLGYSRNFNEQTLDALEYYEPVDDGFAITYRTSEGTLAKVNVTLVGDRAAKVTLGLGNTQGWLVASQDMQLQDEEAIYGAVERIHWWHNWSEGNPQERWSINRRGQWHPMIVQGTIGLYTPFYQSSNGYGLYVDTTFYGWFDFGHFVPDRLRLKYLSEQGRDPILTYYLFFGPGHDSILDQYTATTGRPFIPPKWVFKHWRWRDEHHPGQGLLDGNIVNGELAEDVNAYDALSFPIGNYMIDRPWTPGEQGFAEFAWDTDRFPNEGLMRQSLFTRGYRLIVWGAPWAIGDEPGQNGWEAKQYGYHAPGSDNHIDFSNPDAYAWWKEKVRQFVLDSDVNGWKLDRGDEEQPSFWWNVYANGKTGLEMRNAYPVLYQQCYYDAMVEAWGDDFVNIFRTGWAGSQQYGVIWGGDTRGSTTNDPDNDLGLRSAIISQLHAAFMGFPFWTSDTGGYKEFRNREVFARWLQFSAFCAIMEIGGIGNHAPWNMPTDPAYDPEMIDIYRTYTQLHHDLVDYIDDYARSRSLTGQPVARPLVFDYPDDPTVRDMWDEYLFGMDILVAPVWRVGERQREVYIPAGQFVDYWTGQTHTGPTTIMADAPLDRIPFYIRKGTDVLGKVW